MFKTYLLQFRSQGKKKEIYRALLVMCFYVYLFIFYGFWGVTNKTIPWALVVWMMVSFASVNGCWIDEHRPKLSVPEK